MIPPSHPIADALLVHSTFVQRLARSLANRDADDLAQDTWLRALDHDPAAVRDQRSWLATIVTNLWRNTQRATARRRAHERDLASPHSANEPSVAAIVEREELRRQVVSAVLELPERLRRVVLLRFFEGLDSRTIGERLRLPAPTVRAQVQQALDRLRDRLDAAHGDRRSAWLAPLAVFERPIAPPIAAFTLARAAWHLRTVAAVVLFALAFVTAPFWMRGSAPPVPAPIDVAVADRTADEPPPPAKPTAERTAAAPAPNPDPTAGPEVLWGRVVAAADESPVANAEVVLEHHDADEMNCADSSQNERRESLGTMHTDREGRFRFAVRRALHHRLVVRAPGFATLRAPRITGGCETTLRVDRASFVAGSVKQRDGTPLAGIRVDVIDTVSRGYGEQGVTAADGSFFLGDLPGRRLRICARTPGFVTESRVVDLRPGEGERLDLVVDAGRIARGHVRDAVSGLPIANARVGTWWTMRDAVTTDAGGRYELHGVEERALLHAHAEGFAEGVQNVDAMADVVVVDFLLVRGVDVIGRVVDTAGRPIAATFVAAAALAVVVPGRGHLHWRSAVVADDGRFRITSLAPTGTALWQPTAWRWQLLARAPGFGARVLALPTRGDGATTIDLGDVVLETESILEGRVVDSDGRAVAAARIELQGVAYGLETLLPPGAAPVAAIHHFSCRDGVSAADGTFRFAGLGSGSYRVKARTATRTIETEGGPYVLPPARVTTVPDLLLATGLSISGRLRIDGSLDALRGGRIAIHATGGNSMPHSPVERDGTFCIEGLAPGPYQLSAMDPPVGYAIVPRDGVLAGSRDVELALVPAATIEGRVTAPNGRPLHGVDVSFRSAGVRAVKNVPTDADGRFRLEMAPGMSGSVTASDAANFLRQVRRENVAAGTRDLVLQLPDQPMAFPTTQPR